MSIIDAYFDDSGDGKRERWAVVGGLISRVELWSRFELGWATATFDLKEPFRSTECESQRGQFTDWPKNRCDALMKRLVNLIRGHKLPGWGAIVDIEAYRRIFPGSREYDPFFLAVKHTIAIHARLVHKQGHDLRLWFEESNHNAEITRIYEALKAIPEWNHADTLQGIFFSGKRSNRLQAADLIAREAFKHMDNLGVRPIRRPLKRLHEQWDFQVWNAAALEHLKSRGGPENLEHFTTFWQEIPWADPDPKKVMEVVNRPFDG